jgi:hypothetical protein
MAEFEEIEIVIPGFTPETIPLDRLIEYLQRFADMVGEPREMHLVRIDKSSAKPVLKMPAPTASRVRERISTVRAGRGTREQGAAFRRLRRMVQQDGGEPALIRGDSGVILLSVQPLPPEEGTVVGVRQQTQFDGVLQRVGGSGDYIPVQMRDLSGAVVSGFSAERDVAKAMARNLFEPLRVYGTGSWDRDASGAWSLNRMLIRSFDVLKDEDIGDVLKALRDANVAWPADADDRLASEREAAL